MWSWIELQLMGIGRGEAVSIADKLALIIRLAEMAGGIEDDRGFRQLMAQIHVLSFVG